MAISPTTGSAASTVAAAASLNLPAFALTAGQDVYVGVALDSTASTVTGITDTKGNTYSLVAAKNGTGVRTELWKSRGVAAQAGNVINVAVAPNCNIAAAAEEYASVNNTGNTGTQSGSNVYPYQSVATQDGNNFVIAAIGFACLAGDTLSAQIGTSRQSSIPAATAVGVALYDDTMVGKGTLPCEAEISTARNWATVGLELRSGGASITYVEIPPANMASLQAVGDVRYLRVLEPTFVQGQSLISVNSGFVG